MARFTELVLTALQFHAEGLLNIADMFLSAPTEIRKGLHRIPTAERQWFRESWADRYRNRQQFYRTLNHLKRQGLVAKKIGAHTPHWVLTQYGKERNDEYRQSRRDPFSAAHTIFPEPQGGGITIVAYDIPERERRKRKWIRMCLAEMGGEKIQKSVWVLKGVIDKGFIHALRELDLIGDVHIFAVTRQGTITRTRGAS